MTIESRRINIVAPVFSYAKRATVLPDFSRTSISNGSETSAGRDWGFSIGPPGRFRSGVDESLKLRGQLLSVNIQPAECGGWFRERSRTLQQLLYPRLRWQHSHPIARPRDDMNAGIQARAAQHNPRRSGIEMLENCNLSLPDTALFKTVSSKISVRIARRPFSRTNQPRIRRCCKAAVGSDDAATFLPFRP
jgi:hypothetical protein